MKKDIAKILITVLLTAVGSFVSMSFIDRDDKIDSAASVEYVDKKVKANATLLDKKAIECKAYTDDKMTSHENAEALERAGLQTQLATIQTTLNTILDHQLAAKK